MENGNMPSMKDLAKGRSEIFRFSPYDLHVKEGWNSREEDDPENVAHIDALAKSIAEVGVKETLTVYIEDGKAYVSNGHCRRAAAIRAIEHYNADRELTVPVKAEDKEATEADRIFSQIVRNTGKPFSPLEQATAFKKLNDAGMTDAEIARQAGISRAYVGQLTTLAEMPASIKKYVREGSVAATLAIQIVKANEGDVKKIGADMKAAVAAAKAAGKGKATAKDLRKAKGDDTVARKPRKDRQPAPAPEQPTGDTEAPKRDLGPLTADASPPREEAPASRLTFMQPEADEFDLVGELRAIFSRTEVEDVNDVDKGKVTKADFLAEDYDRILKLLGLTDDKQPEAPTTSRRDEDI